MKCRITYITGQAANLSYDRCMAMTQEEIRAFNERYYRRETVEFELEPDWCLMTDITVRLYVWYSLMSDSDEKRALVGDAMDEINKLRAKIEAISQVAGKASIDGVTFAQIKGRDSQVLGKFTGETHGE